MKTIGYTVATVHYLGQAKALAKSFMQHHPDAQFYIGLVDKLPAKLDKEKIAGLNIIPVEALQIPYFKEMRQRYSQILLVWAMKSYFGQYFFKTFPEVNKVIYMDGDMMVYNRMDSLLNDLDQYEIIITPHFTSTTPTSKEEYIEFHLTTGGAFNAGFFAMSRGVQSKAFLTWLTQKLRTRCVIPTGDQMWFNFIPIFFDKVLISKDVGLNMSFWNFENRHLSEKDGRYFVNNTIPLKVYHFNGENPSTGQLFFQRATYYTPANRPEMVPFYEAYHQALQDNDYDYFLQFPCYYYQQAKFSPQFLIFKGREWLVRGLKKGLRILGE